MGGGGDFRAAGIFFRYQIPCMNVFLGHNMNIFLGLIGVQEFFFSQFSLARIFFVLRQPQPPHPPPPNTFSNNLSLIKYYFYDYDDDYDDDDDDDYYYYP